jgi:formyl-CoA transferase
LRAAFADLDGHEIADKLVRGGVPAGPVLPVDEAMSAPHTLHRQMVTELDGYRGLGTPIKLSRTPGGTRAVPPRFGEHGTAVLARHGFSEDEIADLRESGILLDRRRT